MKINKWVKLQINKYKFKKKKIIYSCNKNDVKLSKVDQNFFVPKKNVIIFLLNSNKLLYIIYRI